MAAGGSWVMGACDGHQLTPQRDRGQKTGSRARLYVILEACPPFPRPTSTKAIPPAKGAVTSPNGVSHQPGTKGSKH